jgi:hypothetical protein
MLYSALLVAVLCICNESYLHQVLRFSHTTRPNKWIFPRSTTPVGVLTRVSSTNGDSSGPIIEIRNFTSIPSMSESEMDYRTDALEMLDCLTCLKDEDDPAYDVEKDIQRDELLINTDYTDLKVELRARGLRTTGDKLEMMVRLLLHIIDPSINYAEMTGRESNLKYVDKDDLDTQKIRIVPENERNAEDIGPDAGNGQYSN